MASSNSWEAVDRSGISGISSEKLHGIKVQFVVSPSDIPRAIRVRKEGEEIVIEFRYLSNSEPLEYLRKANGVRAKVGKNSRRIYKIVISSQAALEGNDGKIHLEFLEDKGGSSNQENINVIRNLISRIYSSNAELNKIQA